MNRPAPSRPHPGPDPGANSGPDPDPNTVLDAGEAAARNAAGHVSRAQLPLVIVTGLAFEGKIAAGHGVDCPADRAAHGAAGRTAAHAVGRPSSHATNHAAGRTNLIVICQQNAALAPLLERVLAAGARGMVSFGTAGGLAPALRPGTWVVARHVVAGADHFATDDAWSARLLAALPDARYGDLAGVAAAVRNVADKRALHLSTGALAADMESAIAARIAVAHRVPFVCCRVVIDPADRSLPPAALAGLRVDGTTDLLAILGSLCAAPAQLPALLRLAVDAGRARRALLQGRAQLGDDFRSMTSD